MLINTFEHLLNNIPINLLKKSNSIKGIISPSKGFWLSILSILHKKQLLYITTSNEKVHQIKEELMLFLGSNYLEKILLFPETKEPAFLEKEGKVSMETSVQRNLVLEKLLPRTFQGKARGLSGEDQNSTTCDYPIMSLRGAKATKQSVLNKEIAALPSGARNDRNGLLNSRLYIILSSVKAILEPVAPKKIFTDKVINLKPKDNISLDKLTKDIFDMGYNRSFLVSGPGEYSKRGCILDVFVSENQPARIEFSYDVIESIKTFDSDSQRSLENLDSLKILPLKETISKSNVLEYMPNEGVIILDEPASLKRHVLEYLPKEFRKKFFNLNKLLKDKNTLTIDSSRPINKDELCFEISALPVMNGQVNLIINTLKKWQKESKNIIIISHQAQRLEDIFSEYNLGGVKKSLSEPLETGQILIYPGVLKSGFILKELNLVVLSDNELFGAIYRFSTSTALKSKKIEILEKIKPGDYLVHQNYGISKFLKLVSLEIHTIKKESLYELEAPSELSNRVQNHKKDYLLLEFAKQDKIYHPIDQMDLIDKFIASEEAVPSLSYLGTSAWNKTKTKIKENIKDMTQKLLKLYATRHTVKGHKFSSDTPWQAELEASFPYEETPDQIKTIQEVKSDMESQKPTDRLICGDSGYGKTEVALRAAFKAVLDAKQVAILVPTTVLAQQHYNTFKERLATFPIKIDMLSRFKSDKTQKEIVSELKEGKIDIIIGTHRLLQKDIHFKDLGLVVIDEEQHFGVAHKEKLKELKKNVDVLTLTATPIPRTFQMALMNLKDTSLIATAPAERRRVKTYLFEYNPEIIKSAILLELERSGQVFFLHNRVQGIERIASQIKRLAPDSRIAIAHGQMPEEKLEKIMYDFIHYNYDILVCTTIIESGIDIPNVNTIIINNAHKFGLAQLYQIRGRVGRSFQQGYAYLLYPASEKLNPSAQKRLKTLQEFSDLGVGFQIALRDLQIRGAGNLLGSQQHGFINSVGFNLYCQLLQESVAELKNEKIPSKLSPVIDLPVTAFIPNEYIEDNQTKLSFYQKMSGFKDLDEVKKIKTELKDIFGPYPLELENLLKILEIRILAQKSNIQKIKTRANDILIEPAEFKKLSSVKVNQISSIFNLTIDIQDTVIVIKNLLEKKDWFNMLRNILNLLA